MYGPPGSGKSHLCAAVRNALGQRGKASVFVSMPDLLESLKALMDAEGDRETYTGRLEKYQRAPLLILDDIGAEKRSDWSESVLFEIVDFRYRNKLASLFVTNLDPFSPDDFDPRVVSRWTDAQLSMVVHNGAPDYRHKAGEA